MNNDNPPNEEFIEPEEESDHLAFLPADHVKLFLHLSLKYSLGSFAKMARGFNKTIDR